MPEELNDDMPRTDGDKSLPVNDDAASSAIHKDSREESREGLNVGEQQVPRFNVSIDRVGDQSLTRTGIWGR